jgi:hypothetical protein
MTNHFPLIFSFMAVLSLFFWDFISASTILRYRYSDDEVLMRGVSFVLVLLLYFATMAQ